MKKILFLLVFSSLLYAQNIRVQDYEVPVSQARNLRFNGTWDWRQVGDSVSSNNINSNLFYRMFYSSLPLAWFLDIDADGFKMRDSLGHSIDFSGRLNKYIWPNADLFGFSRVNISHANYYKEIASNLTVGFGYGRYIDATALAKAVRIEDHLIADKVLLDYLPKETMLNIAHIIEREDEYRSIYGEVYENYWFDAIEEEIAKAGKLKNENIGSIGILRIRQVLFNINEIVNPRYYGWNVSAGILFPVTTGFKTAPGNPRLSLDARYSLPLNWRTQISAVTEINTPFDSSFGKIIFSNTGLDFLYELSNKINFLTNYRLEAFLPYNEKVSFYAYPAEFILVLS
jgi:hypothetical protein